MGIIGASQLLNGKTALTSVTKFDLFCGWQATNGSRLRATFRTEVVGKDEGRSDRVLVRLGELAQFSWQGAPDESLLPHLRALTGKRALVAPQALEGLRLPLKLATLTGQMRFFFE
jgi:hypothetical protein